MSTSLDPTFLITDFVSIIKFNVKLSLSKG
jgi:hypothetical protein